MEYEIGPDERVSVAVVRAVSAMEGRRQTALQPIAEVVDPDALVDLFDTRAGGTARTGGRVTLVYSDCQVTVESGEYIQLDRIRTRPDDRPGSAVSDVR